MPSDEVSTAKLSVPTCSGCGKPHPAIVVVNFTPGKCCLVVRQPDGRPGYCGLVAAGMKPTKGLRGHEGDSCYRCAQHMEEERREGVVFTVLGPGLGWDGF